MNMWIRRTWFLASLLLLAANPARAQPGAQPPADTTNWKRGTTLAIFAGTASASSDTGLVAGGTIGWEVTPRVSIEGSGSWLDRNDGATGFAATMGVATNLLRTRPVAPFVIGGFGLYHASFDRSRGTIPEFYSDRLSEDGNGTIASFTDPAFVIGGGVNIFASRRWSVRPAVEALIAVNDSDTYTITQLTVQLAYHFEERTITPASAH
jgi:hypothetical protein